MSAILVWMPLAGIVLLIKFWKTLRLRWKDYYFFVACYLTVILLVPYAIRRPGNLQNIFPTFKMIAFLSSIIGVKFVLRSVNYFSVDEACVMVINHQQMVDALAFISHVPVIGRVTLAMKKSMSYHPAGLLSALYGVVFVDRSGGKKAHGLINRWAFAAKAARAKVYIHPEGTRNYEAVKSQCLLPFKKGAFYAAIAAQIPIRPVVLSPYYFINNDRKIFGSGHVIMEALPAIPTVGLTKNDVDDLIHKTRTMMTIKFRQLADEILSTLPLTHPVFEWIDDVD